MKRPNAESLTEKWNALHRQSPEEEFPQTLSHLLLRTRRAITWLERAEQANEEDLSVCFIVLWIGFNAAYARNTDAAVEEQDNKARDEFLHYFKILHSCDEGDLIGKAVWERFSQEIRVLLRNKYVFSPFWKYHNGVPDYENWNQRLRGSWRTVHAAMEKRNTPKVLSILFDRLYVLRNQLMHGGATCNSKLGHDQIHDGAAIMAWLLPIFIDLMLDNHEKDWGTPFYPRVDSKPIGDI